HLTAGRVLDDVGDTGVRIQWQVARQVARGDYENPLSVGAVVESLKGPAGAKTVGVKRLRKHTASGHETLLCGGAAKRFCGECRGANVETRDPDIIAL